MPKRYVLRCERNWVLESESDKEEDWLVVAALGDVLEKVLIDFGKLIQRIGAFRLHERLDILREKVVDGRSRWLEETHIFSVRDMADKRKTFHLFEIIIVITGRLVAFQRIFYRQQVYYVCLLLRDRSFTFRSSCLSLEDINYLISNVCRNWDLCPIVCCNYINFHIVHWCCT